MIHEREFGCYTPTIFEIFDAFEGGVRIKLNSSVWIGVLQYTEVFWTRKTLTTIQTTHHSVSDFVVGFDYNLKNNFNFSF